MFTVKITSKAPGQNAEVFIFKTRGTYTDHCP